jgi:hypothetical protein
MWSRELRLRARTRSEGRQCDSALLDAVGESRITTVRGGEAGSKSKRMDIMAVQSPCRKKKRRRAAARSESRGQFRRVLPI